MLTDYGYVALFGVVALLLALSMVLIPFALRFIGVVPHNPNSVKTSTFECGMETIGKTWVQFNFRYYFYALLFVAMDVLIIFLYPFAVGLRKLGSFGLTAAIILIFIVLVGYVYAWKKRTLEWK